MSRKPFLEFTRRAFLAALLLLLLALNVAAADRPILFVHGDGDTAALWHTNLWRFESNGYDPSVLFAIDFTHPRARSDDTKPQENRSSTADQLRELSAKIFEIQSRTGQKQLALVGSSRGGYPIRNYIKNSPGGAANISRVPQSKSMKWTLHPGSVLARRSTAGRPLRMAFGDPLQPNQRPITSS